METEPHSTNRFPQPPVRLLWHRWFRRGWHEMAWLWLRSVRRRVAAGWMIARLLSSPDAPRQPAPPERGNL
jgi:hypothetical protein